MSRANRLQIVEKLARQREDQAAQALAQVRTQLEQENKRLDELHQYQTEYQQYLDTQGGQGISMAQWRRTQGFIDQLSSLIVRQQETINGWQQREEFILGKWRELYQKRKNIAQYIEKISLGEAIADDKKEQKVIDELVSRRF
ncbi:MAG: flagellar export protein FliJ [Reinekea sp.]|jgi:flagellar protein FliJ